MEKNKIFVLADIHGEFQLMEEMLENWREKKERLVILGDLADRGPNSKATIEWARQLANEKDAIIVKGNHDDMLEKYLKEPEKNQLNYYMNGGAETLRSLLGDGLSLNKASEIAKKIKKAYPWLLPFLESLPYFYEWEDYLLVHAGVDLTLKSWKDSTKRDFIWIREGFYDQENTTGKKIIFGHTVTSSLHNDFSNFDLWKSNDGLIGIDGGAVYGGQLNGLRLSKKGIEKVFSIQANN
ncbi:MAG: metallophosphoesterase [Atopostipes suicloacalis]|nr:metallophosphoesterase [Atopostipes suicloacalis]MDN6730921.1 metallophosphoesterase [Atopostipes suicloacalis]